MLCIDSTLELDVVYSKYEILTKRQLGASIR